MKNVTNPVVSEEVAEQIATTFVSVNVDAHLPVSMQSPQDLAQSKADLDDDKTLDESSRNKIRLAISRRESKLIERQMEGGFLEFGQIVTSGVNITTRGLQAYLSQNVRGLVYIGGRGHGDLPPLQRLSRLVKTFYPTF